MCTDGVWHFVESQCSFYLQSIASVFSPSYTHHACGTYPVRNGKCRRSKIQDKENSRRNINNNFHLLCPYPMEGTVVKRVTFMSSFSPENYPVR